MFPPLRGKRSVRRASSVVEVLIVLQAMARLLCDVDMAELAAFCQVEVREGSPRSEGCVLNAAWQTSPHSTASVDMHLAEVGTTAS